MTTKKSFVLIVVGLTLCFNSAIGQNLEFYMAYNSKFTLLSFFKEQKQNLEVQRDNEFEPNYVTKATHFVTNPLLLDGAVLNYKNFGLYSKGELKIVKGNLSAKDAQAIPFYVFIRRNGEFVMDKKMPFFNKQLYRVQLSEIFKFCKNGDDLILKPARVQDWQAKRVLRLFEGC
ncbi:MAG: hypothetical protein JNL70_18490 [Saprospiraceae bacterium]|nr:hypothetical protein [Saprospiraceae bacterium]